MQSSPCPHAKHGCCSSSRQTQTGAMQIYANFLTVIHWFVSWVYAFMLWKLGVKLLTREEPRIRFTSLSEKMWACWCWGENRTPFPLLIHFILKRSSKWRQPKVKTQRWQVKQLTTKKFFLFISLCGFLFTFSFAAGLSRCFSLFLGSYSLLFLNCFSLFSLLCCDLKINFQLSSPLLSSPPTHWVRGVFWSLCLSPSSPLPLIRRVCWNVYPTLPPHTPGFWMFLK